MSKLLIIALSVCGCWFLATATGIDYMNAIQVFGRGVNASTLAGLASGFLLAK